MTFECEVSSPEETHQWGAKLAKRLRPGDLVMLCGNLGAGKTTLAQGIGEGLGVRGPVSSPTFIVARVHPPETGRYPLIHADAYRITDLEDLETLDLDSSLDEAVTVIEWGEGKAENLSDNRLEVRVEREEGGVAPADGDGVIDLAQIDDGHRRLQLRAVGPRWANTNWNEVFEG